MDYFDILLAKKLEGGGGGDVTIEQLDVTENGTYSEPGKAYRPVIVNLPLDEKTITANGTYNASADNLQGFNKVVVNVSGFKLKDMTPGAIASFNDGQALPLTKLLIDIEPVQSGSGDSSPQNERPISGWTECNVNNYGKFLIDTSTIELGKYLATDGSTGSSSSSNVTDYIEIKSNTAYVFAFDFTSLKASGYRNICFYNSNKTFISYVAYTSDVNTKKVIINTPNNAKYVRITTDMNYTDMSLNEDTIYNIEFPSEAGTVYGGTLDVANGVLIVDRAMVDMGTLAWSYSTTKSLFGVNLVDGIHSDNTHLNGICEIYKCVQGYNPSGGINDPTQDNAFAVGSTFISINWNLLVRDSRYSDATAFTTAMDGVKLVYKLTTPITYQLTPTQINALLGVNNIFADTGDILEGQYFAAL